MSAFPRPGRLIEIAFLHQVGDFRGEHALQGRGLHLLENAVVFEEIAQLLPRCLFLFFAGLDVGIFRCRARAALCSSARDDPLVFIVRPDPEPINSVASESATAR